MVKVRKDAKKNKAKIIKKVLSSPLSTQRQIAKEVWLSKTAVQEHLKELPNATKDDRILWICDKDLENVVLWQRELQRRLNDEAKELKTWDIVQIISEWTKRYTIFKWEATDKNWWLTQPTKVNIIIGWKEEEEVEE